MPSFPLTRSRHHSILPLAGALFFIMLTLFTHPATAADCYQTPWQDKWKLETELFCRQGYAVKNIAFRHNKGQNAVHEESFRLTCCRNPGIATNCSWSHGYQSKQEPESTLSAGPGRVVTGIRFRHHDGQNGVHQERFKIRSCATNAPQRECFWLPFESKWKEQEEMSCPHQALAHGIKFFHAPHENGTHQESVSLQCCAHSHRGPGGQLADPTYEQHRDQHYEDHPGLNNHVSPDDKHTRRRMEMEWRMEEQRLRREFEKRLEKHRLQWENEWHEQHR